MILQYNFTLIVFSLIGYLVIKKRTMKVNGVAGYRQHLKTAVSIDVVDGHFP